MAKLPKSLIKKYGISKKAWQVFRSSKSSTKQTKTTKTTKRRMNTMARQKHSFRKSKSGKGFNVGSILNILTGAAIAVAYEVFVSPMIPLAQNIKNWIELAIGLVLAVMPRMPMVVKSAGIAIATVNAYAILYPMISGVGSSSSSNAF